MGDRQMCPVCSIEGGSPLSTIEGLMFGFLVGVAASSVGSALGSTSLRALVSVTCEPHKASLLDALRSTILKHPAQFGECPELGELLSRNERPCTAEVERSETEERGASLERSEALVLNAARR